MVITERYPAVVSSVNDPDRRGRIMVTCPGITGDETTVLPDFIEPVFDWGWFYIPNVDEHVEIEVVVHDDQQEVPGQAFLEEPQMRWRDKRFYDGTEATIHPAFGSPGIRGFATPAGHVLLFDDTSGNEKITIAWKGPDGITDNFIEVSSAGLLLNFTAGKLDAKVLTADIIDGADQFIVRGNELNTWLVSTLVAIFNTHIHPDPVSGVTGVPVTPLTSPPVTILSTVAKVK